MITKNLAKSKVFLLVSCVFTATENVVYGICGSSYYITYGIACTIKNAPVISVTGGAAAAISVTGSVAVAISVAGAVAAAISVTGAVATAISVTGAVAAVVAGGITAAISGAAVVATVVLTGAVAVTAIVLTGAVAVTAIVLTGAVAVTAVVLTRTVVTAITVRGIGTSRSIVCNDAVVLGSVALSSAGNEYHGYKAYYKN